MMKKPVHNPLHKLSWNGEALVKQRRCGQTQVYPEVRKHYNLSPTGYLNKLCKYYYSSAVVRSYQYLWPAVVTFLLRTRASCRHVLVYHMCDLGLQSM